MNLLSLRYFISVAQYLNFTKAAEKLYVSQPTLSRQIMDLEDELGVQLFVRGRHTLKLTESGNLLLNEAVDIINKCDNIKEIIKPIDSKKSGSLKIGYQSFLDTKLMYSALKLVAKDYPHIDFSLLRGTPPELRHQLLSNKCDVIFALNTCVRAIPNIELINLQENKLKIAVPANHHLANRSSVDLKDLANEEFIMLDRKVSPFTVDYAISLCMKSGFSPTASAYVDNAEKALLLTGAGKGITFLHSMIKIDNPLDSYGVKTLDIEGISDDLNFVLAYRQENKKPLTSIFISELNQLHQDKILQI